MPEIGVFGGSGLYSLLDEVHHIGLETPYGDPSGELAIGRVGGLEIAFLPRHGRDHTLPPAAINYRANLWAMKKLGVRQIVAPSAAGSLQPYIRPGDFVICDQFVDRTWGRADTFHPSGPRVAHVSAADPYCPRLRSLALTVGVELGVTLHEKGTVVVIQGPRFSTRSESRWFAAQGWGVVNMTQYPEVILAREMEMCYVNISLITDYDVGLAEDPGIEAVSVAEVETVFASNNQRVKELILSMVPRMVGERSCPCPQSMRNAFLGG